MFQAVAANLCVTMPMLVIFFKVMVFIIKRDLLMGLIKFSEKNFWSASYDDFGEEIMKQCERRSVILSYILSTSVQGTVASYVVAPIFGKQTSNRFVRAKKVMGCNSPEITSISSNHFTSLTFILITQKISD